MGIRPDIEVEFGGGQVKFLKKYPVHLIRVMLSGVDKEKSEGVGTTCTDDGGHLDDLGAGPQDYGDQSGPLDGRLLVRLLMNSPSRLSLQDLDHCIEDKSCCNEQESEDQQDTTDDEGAVGELVR